MRRRIGTAVLMVAGVALIAGCAAATPKTIPMSPPTTSPTTQPGKPVVVSDQGNHTTVRVHVGQLVQVDLSSLYWSDPASTATGVLAPNGGVNRTPSHRCPVGVGCGSLTVSFRAAGAGTANVQAHRSSCGEAMGCSPDQRDFTVAVVVS